jgi:hypothetical protein
MGSFDLEPAAPSPRPAFCPPWPARGARWWSLVGLLGASVGCAETVDDPSRALDAAGAIDDAGANGNGGGGGDGNGNVMETGGFSRDAASCPDVPQEVLVPDCAGAGCHSSRDKAQGLDLQSPNLAARLVGAAATEGSGLLIDPAAPSSSVLYTKLTATPPFGARMPLGAALDGTTTGCVLAWVIQQATSVTSVETGSDGGAPDAAGGD